MPYLTSWERIGIEKGRKIGRKIGMKIGREVGKKEEKLETARRMLNEGLSIPIIIKCIGLTEAEIRTIMNLN